MGGEGPTILNFDISCSTIEILHSIPVRSIFDCAGGGCEVVAMSTDAKYIAVITTGQPQV